MLDRDELAVVLHAYHKTEGNAVSKKRVGREVDEAMTSYDSNGDGVLEFHEFIKMVFGNPDFKMQASTSLRERICRRANEIHAEGTSIMDERACRSKEAPSAPDALSSWF